MSEPLEVEETDGRDPVLKLCANRTIEAHIAGETWATLQPPTLEQWRQIQDAYSLADDGLQAAVSAAIADYPDNVTAAQAKAAQRAVVKAQQAFIYGDGAPYALAFSLALKLLTTSEHAADRLPVWCADPSVYDAMFRQWRRPSIERVERPPAHGFALPGSPRLEDLAAIPPPTGDPLAPPAVPPAAPAMMPDGPVRGQR